VSLLCGWGRGEECTNCAPATKGFFAKVDRLFWSIGLRLLVADSDDVKSRMAARLETYRSRLMGQFDELFAS
jgi:hypothetical protein